MPEYVRFKFIYYDSLKHWNSKNENIAEFKTIILPNVIRSPYYFTYGKREINIIHTRFIHGYNNFNDDLFRVNLLDIVSCSYGSPSKNAFYYFLECKKYCLIRQYLFISIMNIGAQPNLATTLLVTRIYLGNKIIQFLNFCLGHNREALAQISSTWNNM